MTNRVGCAEAADDAEALGLAMRARRSCLRRFGLGLMHFTLTATTRARRSRTERLDVLAQRTYGQPDEYPQQDQESILEQGECQFGHKWTTFGRVLDYSWAWAEAPVQDAGTADGDGVAVEQRGGGHLVALHVRAVGRTQVAGDHAVIRDVDFQVLAGDARDRR